MQLGLNELVGTLIYSIRNDAALESIKHSVISLLTGVFIA